MIGDDIRIRALVLNKAQSKGQIVYGARAINQQVPDYLKKKTEDYDILTKKPKKSAQELANEIRKITSKQVSVEPAKHKGTYKVKINGESVVDYTQIKRTPKTKFSWGNKYYDIKSIKQNIAKRVKDPTKEFRKEKDLDAFRRIKLSEELFDF
jgi:glutamate synthase domain-containing protein 2